MMSNNAFVARTCIVGVVVTSESNMAPYFPEAGNLNGINADMCSDVAGPSSSSSGDLFELSDMSRSHILTIYPATSTTWPPSWIWAWLQFLYCLSGRVTSFCIRSIEVKKCGLSASVHGTIHYSQNKSLVYIYTINATGNYPLLTYEHINKNSLFQAFG